MAKQATAQEEEAAARRKQKGLERAREAKAQKSIDREAERRREEERKLVVQGERVKKSTEEEEKAFRLYQRKGGEKLFNEWLKVDNRLLGEVTALRTLERRLGGNP